MRQRYMLRLSIVLVLMLSACGGVVADPTEADPEVAPAAARWERLPDPPLSPRSLTGLLWTGSELLALGGDTSPPCPPNASCTSPPSFQRDGAAYDPRAGTWRRTAAAPRALVGGVVVDGDVVWAQSGQRADAMLMSYDASADRWSEHPSPPGPGEGSYVLSVVEGMPVALRTDAAGDAIYDPSTRTWEVLPPDPLGPSFERAGVQTPRGLLVTGARAVPNPGSEAPALLRAAVLDPATRSWELLEETGQLVSARGAVHGHRVIWPYLGGADGGETNGYGRTIPFGGVLDTRTGAWQPLRDLPEAGSGGWPVFALGGALSAAEGYLYDDRDGSWRVVLRPEDGPASPGAAGWAGEELVVVGGTSEPSGRYERVQGAWILRRDESSALGE